MNVAIIPARGGSRRIPRKNIRPFFGKPIIAYSIEAANELGAFHSVIVTTDDEEIAQCAMKYGAQILWRPPGLEHNDVGTQEVAQVTLMQLDMVDGYACVIYATAPLMEIDHLKAGFHLLPDKSAFAYSVRGWRDAGQFYWGHVAAFLEGVPLDHWSTRRFDVGPLRYCDINTEDDWQRAEAMYLKLHPEVANGRQD